MTGLPPPEELARLLYASVVSDTLDSAGLRHQALRPFIRPLDEALLLFGRARTGRYEPADLAPDGHNPYALEMDLIDSLRHTYFSHERLSVLAGGRPEDLGGGA